jgi:hypothetical protein
VRVLAKSVQAGDPDPLVVSMGGGTWHSAAAALTVRGAGGLDPERFVPIVRFGTSAQAQSVPVLPATTNDLLVTAFAQRHPAASTGTLTVPAGLVDRGFWRPSGGTTGYTLRLATAQLGSGARTAGYTSTSNDATGTWASVAFTVPAGDPPRAPVVQSEPAGPPGGLIPFLPRA